MLNLSHDRKLMKTAYLNVVQGRNGEEFETLTVTLRMAMFRLTVVIDVPPEGESRSNASVYFGTMAPRIDHPGHSRERDDGEDA
jgi:hypothetical protein